MRQKRPKYATSIGINIIHDYRVEASLDYSVPISEQRSIGMFAGPMSKPNVTGIPVIWSNGVHHRELPANFDDLFLFHLRYADLRGGLDRLATTRVMDLARPDAARHQRVSDTQWQGRIDGWLRLPRVENDPWSCKEGILASYVGAFRESEELKPGEACYRLTTKVYLGNELLRIPEEFQGSF